MRWLGARGWAQLRENGSYPKGTRFGKRPLHRQGGLIDSGRKFLTTQGLGVGILVIDPNGSDGDNKRVLGVPGNLRHI